MDTAETKRTLAQSGDYAAPTPTAPAGAQPTSSTSAGSAESPSALRSPSCLASPDYSPMTVGATPPRRHSRRVTSASVRAANSISASASASVADGEVLRPCRREASREGASRLLLSSAAPAPPFPAVAQDDPPSSRGRRDGEERHISSRNSNGRGGASPSEGCGVAGARLWRRTTQRFLWIFWRRRAVVNLRARLRHRTAKLLRHPWGRRLITTAAVVFVALFWFLVITAVVGPAGGNSKSKKGVNGDKKGGDPGGDKDSDRHRSYYRRIDGKVAVGPSLSDPWKVREISIAAADWGLGGSGPSDDGGGGGSGGDVSDSGSSGSRSRGDAQGRRVKAGGGNKREEEEEEEEWDGRVNSVITGALEPVGRAKTRPKVDLLLTIFSGTTEVRYDCVRTKRTHDKHVSGSAGPPIRHTLIKNPGSVSEENYYDYVRSTS